MNTLKGRIFAVLLVLLVGANVISGFFFPGNNSARSSSHVTLRSAPGNGTVQMLSELRDDPDVRVTTFGDGMGCTKVSDLLRYGNGDTAMFFYRLNCGGTIGYVNADWIDD